MTHRWLCRLALFGIFFVRYGNWISRAEQVENAPKFPRLSEGGNQFTNVMLGNEYINVLSSGWGGGDGEGGLYTTERILKCTF